MYFRLLTAQILITTLLLNTSLVFAKSQYNTNTLKSQFSSWGVNPQLRKSSINLKNAWTIFNKKKDIIVAVVDTGIQFNHPFLRENIVSMEGKTNARNFGKDFSTKQPSTRPVDTHGHGTHVAGIIKSIFPEVKILPVKYYNPKASGQQNLKATIQALNYAIDMNVDMINYSGGGPEPSKAEVQALKRAKAKGILVVAAAGNESSNIDLTKNAYYPASYGLSNIISVGAHDQKLNIIKSSNWGEKSVDIAAPGFRIQSAIHNGSAGRMTGTSQATAFVTAVAALLKSQFPKLNVDQIKNIILSSSVKIQNFQGKVLGAGKLDAYQAIKLGAVVNNKLYGKPSRRVAKKRSYKKQLAL